MITKPEIVCMCGSTRFKQAWIWEKVRLTSLGYIVLDVGLFGHHMRVEPTPEEKEKLDELHKRKIDISNWVYIIDVGGYIGDSTRDEIEYAKLKGKPVLHLTEQYGQDYVEPEDPLKVACALLHRFMERGPVKPFYWTQKQQSIENDVNKFLGVD